MGQALWKVTLWYTHLSYITSTLFLYKCCHPWICFFVELGLALILLVITRHWYRPPPPLPTPRAHTKECLASSLGAIVCSGVTAFPVCNTDPFIIKGRSATLTTVSTAISHPHVSAWCYNNRLFSSQWGSGSIHIVMHAPTLVKDAPTLVLPGAIQLIFYHTLGYTLKTPSTSPQYILTYFMHKG